MFDTNVTSQTTLRLPDTSDGSVKTQGEITFVAGDDAIFLFSFFKIVCVWSKPDLWECGRVFTSERPAHKVPVSVKSTLGVTTARPLNAPTVWISNDNALI